MLLKRTDGPGTVPKLIMRPTDHNVAQFFQDVQDVSVSQSGTLVSIFALTKPPAIKESTICSLIVATLPSGSAEVSQPLVPIYGGDIREFCPIFHTPSQSHHFLLLTQSGGHVLLQFKPGNSVWEETSFLISNPPLDTKLPAMTSTISYQSRAIVKDSFGSPLSNQKLLMTAADTSTVTLNGQVLTLGPKAVEVTTDERGCLSIISPADSLGSSGVFRVFTGTFEIGGPIDPSINVRQRLTQINSGQALREQRVQSDGSLLLKDINLPNDTIDEAGKQLGQLHAQLSSLPPDGSAASVTSLGLFNKAWAAWHYVEHKAVAAIHEVKVVENKIVAIVIKIGDEAVHFVVDTAARALKAINYVLKKIQLDLRRICDVSQPGPPHPLSPPEYDDKQRF